MNSTMAPNSGPPKGFRFASPRAQRKVAVAVQEHARDHPQQAPALPPQVPSAQQQMLAQQRARAQHQQTLQRQQQQQQQLQQQQHEQEEEEVMGLFKARYLGFLPLRGGHDQEALVRVGLQRFFADRSSGRRLDVALVVTASALTVVDRASSRPQVVLPVNSIARMSLASRRGGGKPKVAVLLTANPDKASEYPLMLHFVKATTRENKRFFGTLSNVFNAQAARELGNLQPPQPSLSFTRATAIPATSSSAASDSDISSVSDGRVYTPVSF
mgnify:CR=1 FL=1